MNELIFEDFDATCHTDNCANAEIKICVKVNKDEVNVFCGVCGLQITDVVRVN